MDERLLQVLACPDCHGDIKLVKKTLICQKCKRKFEIKNGIPVMLPLHSSHD
jgi:uncharacterized protein YbaR (Trm112 family)